MRLNFDIVAEESSRGGYAGLVVLVEMNGTKRVKDIVLYRSSDLFETTEAAENHAINRFLKRIGF